MRHRLDAWTTETLRLLVTVKAYPAVGKKHGEAVCVAGIDVDSPRWVRLYPVPFRDLPNPNRFKKYETIELQARKAATDQRPESYTPNTGSIMVVRKSLPAGKARERRAYVEPLASASMCEIRRRRETDGTSLGVFRPAELLDFEVEEDRTPWDPEKQGRVDQTSLLMPGKQRSRRSPTDSGTGTDAPTTPATATVRASSTGRSARRSATGATSTARSVPSS